MEHRTNVSSLKRIRLISYLFSASYCALLSGLCFGETASTNLTPVVPETNATQKTDPMAAVSLFLDWITGEGGSERVGLHELTLGNYD